MKIKVRHIIAVPFLGFSAYLLIEFLRNAPSVFSKSWEHVLFGLIFSGILIFVVTVPGVLALQRRWEDFVKIIGVFVAIAAFTLLSQHTSALAKSADVLIGTDYPLLGAFWGMCVAVAPFAISIIGYQRLVPLIVRRIYKAAPANL